MTLRQWIETQNMTQQQAADLLGVHAVTLNRYLSGKLTPRRAMLEKVREVTGGAVQPADFFGEVVA